MIFPYFFLNVLAPGCSEIPGDASEPGPAPGSKCAPCTVIFVALSFNSSFGAVRVSAPKLQIDVALAFKAGKHSARRSPACGGSRFAGPRSLPPAAPPGPPRSRHPVTYTRRPLPLAPGAGPGPVADEAAYESPGSFSGGCANRQPPRAPPEGLGAARALTTAKIMTHLAGGGGRGGARPWRGRRRGTGRRGRAGPAGLGRGV